MAGAVLDPLIRIARLPFVEFAKTNALVAAGRAGLGPEIDVAARRAREHSRRPRASDAIVDVVVVSRMKDDLVVAVDVASAIENLHQCVRGKVATGLATGGGRDRKLAVRRWIRGANFD